MKLKLTILIQILTGCLLLSGQTLEKIKSVKLQHRVVNASTDRQGNLYVASNNGDIDRFDKSGDLAYHFSPDKKGNATLIEAWQGLRTFVFYRDFQQYLFLDRFLNNSTPFDIGNGLSTYFELGTIAGDNNLWLIDQQELTLKKLDIEISEFLVETPLNLNLDPDNYELSFIREYQNLLFISDKSSGVLVFDNLGNYLESLPLTGLNHFSFSGNELLGLNATGDKAMLIDIYTKKEREISLPDPSYQFVFMENSRLYCVAAKRIDIFKLD
ncbi:MAG: hypothetical protein Roseis2KO_14680 [Roseivirga sp.]